MVKAWLTSKCTLFASKSFLAVNCYCYFSTIGTNLFNVGFLSSFVKMGEIKLVCIEEHSSTGLFIVMVLDSIGDSMSYKVLEACCLEAFFYVVFYNCPS